MSLLILFRCFLIGVLASSTFGPIFMLTFNRGALYGFVRGFATALGACLVDGIYFFLGLFGILAVLKESRNFMFFIDIFGAVLLILLGIKSFQKAKKGIGVVCIEDKFGVVLTMIKSFLLTLVNPLVLVFFMFIGIQILPPGVETLTVRQVFFGSIMVMLGSLSVLSIVALVASFIGSCISEKSLKLVSFLTGVVFIVVGIYFLDDAFFGFVNKIKLLISVN